MSYQTQFFEERTHAESVYSNLTGGIVGAGVVGLVALILAIVAFVQERRGGGGGGTVFGRGCAENFSMEGQSTVVNSDVFASGACEVIANLIGVCRVAGINEQTDTTITLQLASGNTVPASWTSANRRLAISTSSTTNLTYQNQPYLPVISATEGNNFVILQKDSSGTVEVEDCTVLGALRFQGTAESQSCTLALPSQTTGGDVAVNTKLLTAADGGYLFGVSEAQRQTLEARVPGSTTTVNNQPYFNLVSFLAGI